MSISDKKAKARSIELFRYFVQFLEIFGQENYGESAEVYWPAVYNFCSQYKLPDFNTTVEEIVYQEKDEDFRDKCFKFMEDQILHGYPVWRLFKMSAWLQDKCEQELMEREIAKDKKYFEQTTRCYRCKFFEDRMSFIDKATGYPKNIGKDDVIDWDKGQLCHFIDCKKRNELLEEKIGDKTRFHYSRDSVILKYRGFNLINPWGHKQNGWTMNPWHLRKCPYFEQDPEMTYEKFLHDYKEIIRYEAERDMRVKKANEW